MNQQQAVIRSLRTDNLLPSERRQDNASSMKYVLVFVLLGATCWLFITKLDYGPGSDLGYNLGLIGGVAMLSTLFYPVAKRVRFMHSWIRTKHWFLAHMVLGIVGPVFILLHSKLTLESANGTVAFCAMWLVFFSGFTGRYLHRKIHSGLKDRRAFLQQVKQKIGVTDEHVRSRFRYAPRIHEHLGQFEASVLNSPQGLLPNFWHFLTMPFRVQRTYTSARRDLKQAIKRRARERRWDRRKARRRLGHGKRVIRAYLEAVRSVARISAYERLFSLWHIIHMPLLFWLAITGAFHVLAVHMY